MTRYSDAGNVIGQRVPRSKAEGDVEKPIRCGCALLPVAVALNHAADRLVARTGQPEIVGGGADAAAQLGDRSRAVVASFEVVDEPRIETWRAACDPREGGATGVARVSRDRGDSRKEPSNTVLLGSLTAASRDVAGIASAGGTVASHSVDVIGLRPQP